MRNHVRMGSGERRGSGARRSAHGGIGEAPSLRGVAVLAAFLLLACALARPALAQPAPTPLGCPTTAVDLDAGSWVISSACVLPGDLVVRGSATLFVDGTSLTVDGDVRLSGDARLYVRSSRLTIDQRSVLQHRIESHDSAQLHFVASVLSTNARQPGASLASQYVGHDQSVLRVLDSHALLPDSWLLADLQGDAVVHTTNSKNFPSEIYPHERSTVIIEGRDADHRVWLEFLSGSVATVSAIPDTSAPFSFRFGRETPGTQNVGWQVIVEDAVATFGLASHPGSDVTLERNAGPVAIAYFLEGLTSDVLVTSLHPGLRNATLTHQGRTLRFVDANLEGFAWQLYGSSAAASPPLVRIRDSMLNELVTLRGGRFSVARTLFQWAVVAALGPGSAIDISESVLNSQTILAAEDAFVRIDASRIYGALIQARDRAVVVLTNVEREPNVCHPLCLPTCPSFADGGCNWFLDPEAPPRLEASDDARILVVGVDEVAAPLARGARHDFNGDAFAEVAPDTSVDVGYELRWFEGATGRQGTIASSTGERRGARLGTLDTTDLAPGAYLAVLELRLGSTPAAVAIRPFTVSK